MNVIRSLIHTIPPQLPKSSVSEFHVPLFQAEIAQTNPITAKQSQIASSKTRTAVIRSGLYSDRLRLSGDRLRQTADRTPRPLQHRRESSVRSSRREEKTPRGFRPRHSRRRPRPARRQPRPLAGKPVEQFTESPSAPQRPPQRPPQRAPLFAQASYA